MNALSKLANVYRKLWGKKHHLEFFIVLLTIPFLITLTITNLQNLNKNFKEEKDTTSSVKGDAQSMEECKKEIGPIEITYPKEGEIVSQNPLCVDISYATGEYCSVVWSYRINDGEWSDYNNKSICIYDMKAGTKNLRLKVKSIVTDDELILQRDFVYQNNSKLNQ